MEFYQAALDIATKRNDGNAKLRLYCNMANVMELQMQFEAAIEYMEKMLEIATDKKKRDSVVKACGTLASLHHLLGNEMVAMK